MSQIDDLRQFIYGALTGMSIGILSPPSNRYSTLDIAIIVGGLPIVTELTDKALQALDEEFSFHLQKLKTSQRILYHADAVSSGLFTYLAFNRLYNFLS